ncbi:MULTISPECIES: alpha/beta-type small acid-soluble spore protein [unclassified Sedimentibacter]|uniref:alpha/beta-type small acid-soluble spore protein n=1 Tax=unclassified Sedimentibacter TaxID=2649220 RepID=UPI0027E163B4|nr:alpha/beta-type small acid-soluble spore protein [Sedimentibacter sp. MB35-C1]WMJ78801.1 alpha/beta-type small acid-soluble spore protein [Sedimentibacter sp. MB35-C1]
MSSNNNGNNRVKVPEAKQALNQMKLEIANELGLSDYDKIDKGNLTSRQNGYVGGYMVRNLVELAQKQMAGQNGTQIK